MNPSPRSNPPSISARTICTHLSAVDLRTILFPSETESRAAAELLNQTRLTQPALFVIEYAMAKLWISWGIEPAAMIGHSVGELAAACIAGVFTLEAGLEIIAERGRLIQSMPTGSMTAVPIPEREVLPLLNGKLSLASVNCDDQCVVSGPDYAIGDLEEVAGSQGNGVSPVAGLACISFEHDGPDTASSLPISCASSSSRRRGFRYISSATGNWITDAEATDPNYWAGQLRQTVRFADGIGNALKTPDAILLEVGPGNTLSALCEQSPQFSDSQQVISSLRTRTDDTSDDEFLARALGQLWTAGKKIDWKSYHAHENRRRLPIPTYPFQRERFWIEPGRKIETDATPSTESASEDPRDWIFFTVMEACRSDGKRSRQ